MADSRAKLLALLVERSFRQSDTPRFRLASGKTSRFYVDCRATTLRGDAMALVGEAVAELLPAEVTAVGGLTMGADPVAISTAYWANERGRALDAFVVRKETKGHGLGRWVEGAPERGARVAVVDDVCTTGGSTIRAIERCREEGLDVVAVIVLVDREEGGRAAVEAAVGPDVPVRAVFTRSELQEGA